MSLPDPRETPTLTFPEAGVLLGVGRSAAYSSPVLNGIAIEVSAGRKVVPTAALLKLLGNDDAAPAHPNLLCDALAASALELAVAIEEANRALRHVQDAIAGAAAIAGITTSNVAAHPMPNMSDGGPASPPTATDTATGGPRHDGRPLRVV